MVRARRRSAGPYTRRGLRNESVRACVYADGNLLEYDVTDRGCVGQEQRYAGNPELRRVDADHAVLIVHLVVDLFGDHVRFLFAKEPSYLCARERRKI